MNQPNLFLKLEEIIRARRSLIGILVALLWVPAPAIADTGSPTTTYTLPTSTGGSNGGASQAASSAGGMQTLSAGVNVVFGGYMASQCSQKNPMACMIAAQSMEQAASLATDAAGSNKASQAMSGSNAVGSGDTDGSGISGLNDPTGTSATAATSLATPSSLSTQVAALRTTLAQTGTTVSADGSTVTLPDGRQVSSSTGGSASDLASAGFSPAEVDAGLAAMKLAQAKVADKIQAMKVAGADGGGGGGPGGGAAGGTSGPDFAALMRKLHPDGKNTPRASIAGMSKKLGNDNIGVAGDNIFDMVSRRYRARDTQNGFIK